MHFGHPPHQASDDDLMILRCPSCGWVSEELTRDQVTDLGAPLACQGRCGNYNVVWVRFHPRERDLARSVAGLQRPTQRLPTTRQGDSGPQARADPGPPGET